MGRLSLIRKCQPWPWLLFACAYGLSAATYFVVRYGGRWTDTDTSALTQAIRVFQAEGTLLPQGVNYSTGYAYQAIAAFFAQYHRS